MPSKRERTEFEKVSPAKLAKMTWDELPSDGTYKEPKPKRVAAAMLALVELGDVWMLNKFNQRYDTESATWTEGAVVAARMGDATMTKFLVDELESGHEVFAAIAKENGHEHLAKMLEEYK